MKKMKNKSILILIVFFLIVASGSFFLSNSRNNNLQASSQSTDLLRQFTSDEIKPFDGTDENKPIYIAYNGLVYDVSAGREFYRLSGPYHYLAGRDSSIELNIAGGGIIKNKYPVVGQYVK